jgi:hypothetical protein
VISAAVDPSKSGCAHEVENESPFGGRWTYMDACGLVWEWGYVHERRKFGSDSFAGSRGDLTRCVEDRRLVLEPEATCMPCQIFHNMDDTPGRVVGCVPAYG